MLKNIFKYSLDAYFVFKETLQPDDTRIVPYSLPGYSFVKIDSIDDNYFDGVCSLWLHAYHNNDLMYKNNVCETLKNIFADGDICVCLLYDDEVVGMGWLGYSTAINRLEFSMCIKDQENSSIGHHSYIIEKHRGKGLQKYLDKIQQLISYENNIVNRYVFVGVKNMASVRNSLKVNEYYRLIYHLKIDIPFFIFNFFPGYRKEDWDLCKKHHDNLRK